MHRRFQTSPDMGRASPAYRRHRYTLTAYTPSLWSRVRAWLAKPVSLTDWT